MPRKALPPEIEKEVLLLCRRRCCVCYGLNRNLTVRQGQIAHLDRDAAHNQIENLAFLCLLHHDQYDSRTSQSKGLTESEVRHFRQELHDLMGGSAPAKIGDTPVYKAQPPVTTSEPDREATRRKKFEANPFISLSDLEIVWLDMDEHEMIFHLHREDAPSHVRAAILSVYYDPNESLSRSPLSYIRASAKFTDKQTKKILVIPALFWIDEYLQWTNLLAGDEKILVLLLFNSDGSTTVLANKRRSYDDPYAETVAETVSDSLLPDAEYEVLITFIWGGDEYKQSHPLQLSKPSLLLSGSSLG